MLHCDIARKAGRLVWLWYNSDSGNPARWNPLKRTLPVSGTFVCLFKSAFLLWSAGKWVPVVPEPRKWPCVCVPAHLGSGHGTAAAHRAGLCPRSSPEPPWLLKAIALVLWSTVQPCPWAPLATACLESSLISEFFLHVILPATTLSR